MNGEIGTGGKFSFLGRVYYLNRTSKGRREREKKLYNSSLKRIIYVEVKIGMFQGIVELSVVCG